jgi:hypothetical protein|tara:strand:- start:16314 stop:17522 length:1209 start_codon:yes stop_codon:yes gene_type:complete
MMVRKPKCVKEKSKIKISLCDSIELIHKEHWNQTNSIDNIYLSIPYLKAIESTLLDELSFRYLQFYDEENKPIGMAVVQIVSVRDNVENHDAIFCSVAENIRKKLLKTIDAKILVCGNLFSCGENGYAFEKSISSEDTMQMLNNGLKRIRESENINNNQISYYLLKEFWPESFPQSDALRKHDFKDFMIDVNMVLPIHKEWKSFDDYLASMTTKFRTKAKSAFKKSAELAHRQLSATEIEDNSARIQELFDNVVDQSEFSLGELKANTFIELKRAIGVKLKFTGYYLNETLVGFCCATILSNGSIEANYVGLDYEVNRSNALYQRMLYNLVAFAIEKGLSKIHFGRTAEELKSTLGALPIDMKLYIRHRNKLSNQLLKPIISSINPSEFELRNPFKANFTFG